MNDAATMVGYREIIVDEIFPHTPEAVWETLTTPELMGRWLMEAVLSPCQARALRIRRRPPAPGTV